MKVRIDVETERLVTGCGRLPEVKTTNLEADLADKNDKARITLEVPDLNMRLNVTLAANGQLHVWRSVLGQHPNHVLFWNYADHDEANGMRSWSAEPAGTNGPAERA